MLSLRAERNIFFACEFVFSAPTKAFSDKTKQQTGGTPDGKLQFTSN